MEISASTTIDRSVADVWQFWAVDHIRNHPRWDPDMELEPISDGPMGLGSTIRRRNMRWDTPVEGEMEVIEWEPERSMGLAIHDANMQMRGRTTFQEQGLDRTLLTMTVDVPGLDGSKSGFVESMMERSLANAKSLMEAEAEA
jgi:uncharacterized protein YndB with AHSA1/START domain